MIYTYDVEDDGDVQRLFERLDRLFGDGWWVVDYVTEDVPFFRWLPWWPVLKKIKSITVEFS